MQIDVDSPAVAHGLGLFETLLCVDGRVAFVDEHHARMATSAQTLGLPIPGRDAFRATIAGAAKNATSEAAIRCLYLGADPWILTAHAGPIPRVTRSRRERGRAITLDPSMTRALPEHKLTSYAVCVIGLQHAIAADADEGLFVTRDRHVLEGTSTNVFAVDGDALITAPAGVLPGIVRDWVLREARANGIRIEERAPTIDELRNGAFLTSSLTTLAPIQQIDGIACRAPGEIYQRLRERFLTPMG